jgi:hypothetical protein
MWWNLRRQGLVGGNEVTEGMPLKGYIRTPDLPFFSLPTTPKWAALLQHTLQSHCLVLPHHRPQCNRTNQSRTETVSQNKPFLFCFWWCWGLKTLPGRQVLYHLSHTASPFCTYFVNTVSLLCPGQPGPPFYLHFPCDLDNRLRPPHSAFYWFKRGLKNFLHGLTVNCNSPNFHFPSSEDYRCDPLCLAKPFLFLS